ncbi:MAG: dicarboxylate/amino acid:cation symporter [Bacteroidota bacterium]|nr:MAG: dicarboxylate/amino acid:cation symporter [Bacteroidota bacterium]
MLNRVALHWQILIGIILGAFIGVFLPSLVPGFSIAGTLFLRALKMIVVPLIFSSMISGVASLGGGKSLGRIGGKTLFYFLITSLLALVTGLALVNWLQPGVGKEFSLASDQAPNLASTSFLDTLIGIIPDNIIGAMVKGDMLAIIFFSILAGIFISKLETSNKAVLTNFFDAFFDLMMKITLFVIRFAPLGIMGIIAQVVSEQDNISELMIRLGKFSLVVILGISIHYIVTLPLFLLLIARVNPIKHFKALISVMLTAFSTASSNATLPLTLKTVEEESGVSNKIASFVLPLGATINMNGTALYELVVAGFVAQLLGIDLSISQQIILVSTALLASIGTAGIPMASFVTMAIVFTAVGLPVEYMLIVMPVDRPLDMLRTSLNVFGDTVVTVLVAKSEGEKLNY